jgi:oligosaccharyltransferase complex subunit beta
LTKWTFQEKSALDVVAVQHHMVGEEEAPAHYRIKDNMVRSRFQLGYIV